MQIEFTLNGKGVTIEAEGEERLLDVLRNNFDLIGVKEACGEGRCGSCSVMIDGKIKLACLTPVLKVRGKKVITIEGLGSPEKPNYVQQAFVDVGAVQCGFCTPGMIVSITEYIENGGQNEREAIKKAVAGNLCRCTGYTKIVDAVELAFKLKNENHSN